MRGQTSEEKKDQKERHKPTFHAAPRNTFHLALALVSAVLPHYVCTVRPGLVLSTVFWYRQKQSYWKLATHLFCHFVLDMIIIPSQVFSELERRRTGGRRDNHAPRATADGELRGTLFNERMYKSLTFYAGQCALTFSSKPLMGVILATVIYEPRSTTAYLLSLYWVYTRIQCYYNDYMKVDGANTWMFVSFSLFPAAHFFFIYCIACSYGDYYYTGDQPLPTLGQMFVQMVWWVGSHLTCSWMGNTMASHVRSSAVDGSRQHRGLTQKVEASM